MNWKKFVPFLRQNGTAERSLIDREYVEESICRSPVPIVLVLVLIWMVSAVLLLLSENRQRDLTVRAADQKAPFSVFARIDFSYEDSIATEKLRQEARQQTPGICRIVPEDSDRIKKEIWQFFSTMQKRETAELEKKVFVPADDPGSKLASQVIDYKKVLKQYRLHQSDFARQVDIIVRHGVASEKLSADIAGYPEIQVVSPDGKSYTLRPPVAESCARTLAETLKLTGTAEAEFYNCIKIILLAGNLQLDAEKTEARASAAAAAVEPVIKNCRRGELLVEREQNITRQNADMLRAEQDALPRGYGIVLLCNRLALSFLLLLISLFFLYRTYPQIFHNPRRFSIAGLALIMALMANFGAMQLFFYFFRHGIMPDYGLMFFMMPIPFGAALLSILLGNRTALFAGFLVAAISSLMILPDRSFELALRWFAIIALMSMMVRNISNYRSFFVRVLFCGGLLTLVVNCDVLYSFRGDMRLIKIALLAVAANVFLCAMADLLAVFAFELFFNVDTTMSLMVLTDFNHPLLNKLKREAPGTMFHSMTVATLAEDAAKAIGANPARAKAGALFHDIGKLSMPQYFVENNIDSPKMHEELPPQRSCGIIRGHVKEGLDLAREYRLCRFVRDAIGTHHGDDLISFFYRRALENNTGEVLESQFRYDGNPPVDKELTIISLADACEAACRSLSKPTSSKIEALVNDIFIGRIRGGQLRNSELTASELNIVRECFIEDLISINHGRIAYQKENQDDTTALQLEEPKDAGTEKK